MNSRDTEGDPSARGVGQEKSALEQRPPIEEVTTPAVGSEGERRSSLGDSARFDRSRYRTTTAGLVAVGLLAAAGGVVFPGTREVLFALAATGLFGGVLASALRTERFVPGAVSERVYDSTARNGAAFVDALELSDRRIYVPVDDRAGVVLFVPASEERSVPADPTVPWSADEEPDLVLEPTGAGLFREVDRKLPGDLEPGLEPTGRALAEGLVEVLEIAGEADANADPEQGTLTVDVEESAFGAVDRFDHPVASYLAVGLASTLDRPISLEVRPGDGTEDWRVICSWQTGE